MTEEPPEKSASLTLNPSRLPSMEGRLKRLAGGQSDDWNEALIHQTISTIWTGGADVETCKQRTTAAVAAMGGMAPQDELEGMLAAQLVAVHNAAMECYRRAMIPEQTFEGRSQNLSQANKLSRTQAMLLDALNKHRGKGQQRVTVEHVHVNAGGQAIVGAVQTKGGGGDAGN